MPVTHFVNVIRAVDRYLFKKMLYRHKYIY